MQQFLDGLLRVIDTINAYLSDYILVVLLLGIGIFYSIRTRFVQVRCFGQGLRNVFGARRRDGGKSGGMSPFQAFTTAVAAQVGTGNIVGSCTAILAGGPGAIFWMWVVAFFGMATIYAEAVLAQKTRIVGEDGSISGGPVHYIRTAFRGRFGKFLAGFFAVAIIIALGFVGSMVQSNSIATAVHDAATVIPTWVIGIVVAVLAAVIFLGGVKRIASVTEKIVPIMAILYLLGGFVVLGFRITAIPEAIGMIFRFAFTPDAVIGGGIGYALKTAVSMGAKRGLFSNEAGMGSTPHAHAQAQVEHAHQQGTTAMVSVFLDTFVVLTMTALIVLTTLYAQNGPVYRLATEAAANGESVTKVLESAGYTGNSLVRLAIASLFTDAGVGGMIGAIAIAVCLAFFAFSTIISWNLFGKINFEYLFGKRVTFVYSILCIVFIFLGSLLSNGLVWSTADLFNYLMVIPNALALAFLSHIVVEELRQNGKHDLKRNAGRRLKGVPTAPQESAPTQDGPPASDPSEPDGQTEPS